MYKMENRLRTNDACTISVTDLVRTYAGTNICKNVFKVRIQDDPYLTKNVENIQIGRGGITSGEKTAIWV